jgi:enoyl-CoA hydratase
MPVDYDQRGMVAVITLNRPEARNAINADMAKAIEAAIDRVEGEDAVRVAILAAAPPVFCAGADLKEMNTETQVGSRSTERGGFAGIALRERSKPIIAAVDGPALAGGTEIVLSCDLVVASTRASFGLSEVKRGLIAGAGGLYRMARRVPLNVAIEVAITGEPLDATRAYECGLVNRLVAPDTVVEEAARVAEVIATNAPIAVRESRRVVLRTPSLDDEAAWQFSQSAWDIARASDDASEGVAAFVEKRAPRWSGR